MAALPEDQEAARFQPYPQLMLPCLEAARLQEWQQRGRQADAAAGCHVNWQALGRQPREGAAPSLVLTNRVP